MGEKSCLLLNLYMSQQVLSKSLLSICMKELSKCQLERGGELMSIPWVSNLGKYLWVKDTQLFPECSPGLDRAAHFGPHHQYNIPKM